MQVAQSLDVARPRFNYLAWNTYRLEVEARIRELKKLRTEAHQPGYGWRQESEFLQLRRVASFLYLTRSEARGRTRAPGKHEKEWTKNRDTYLQRYVVAS